MIDEYDDFSEDQSETLLDKARQNYNVAKMIFTGSSGDEIYLNYVGYHLQQAVELAIKYGMESFGVKYPPIHDIEQLILKCKKNHLDIGLTEYILDHSEMLTEWESKTRYIKNYRLESRKIEKAMEEIPSLIVSIEKAVEQTFEQETDYER